MLARHREAVDAACDQLFPGALARGGTVNNGQGWWAGRATADRAVLGADTPVLGSEQGRAAS